MIDVPLRTPFLEALLDLCVPPRCLACAGTAWEAGENRLCRRCARALPRPAARCPACGRSAPALRFGRGCPRCVGPDAARDALRWSGTRGGAARRALRGVVAAWPYAGTARDLVLALKFHGRPEAARPLGWALTEVLQAARIPGDLVVPVPLSRRRRLQRGYNQAALLARCVARGLGRASHMHGLVRRRHDRPQSGLSGSARRVGPRGAFVARERVVRERCILLVDDVLTSGATAQACATALRAAGAQAVTAAVVCRAERG